MNTKYLIIGGGPCGDAAVKSIREYDKEGDITLITNEEVGPYRRMSLTKQIWITNDINSISLKTQRHNINLITNNAVVNIKPEDKLVTCANGDTYSYEKLLIATGINPRKLPCENIIYYRNIKDYEILRNKIDHKENVLIIGCGFTGLELASELKKLGKNIKMIFLEDYTVDRFVPLEFSIKIMNAFRENGIELINSDTVENITEIDDSYKITTRNGQKFDTDCIIASVGNLPAIDFLKDSNIEISNGIKVDKYCQTNIKDIYSAGDVAEFPSELFNTNMRREFMDNAVKMGKVAGANMCGQNIEYNPILSTFFDAFSVSYNACGEYSCQMRMSFKNLNDEEYIIFYRKENTLQGIMFWKTKPNIQAANKIISEKLTLSDEEYINMLGK